MKAPWLKSAILIFSLSTFHWEEGTLTQMALITSRTSIPNSSDHDVPNSIVALAATRIGDLDLAAAIGAWRGFFLPMVSEGNNFASVLFQEKDR